MVSSRRDLDAEKVRLEPSFSVDNKINANLSRLLPAVYDMMVADNDLTRTFWDETRPDDEIPLHDFMQMCNRDSRRYAYFVMHDMSIAGMLWLINVSKDGKYADVALYINKSYRGHEMKKFVRKIPGMIHDLLNVEVCTYKTPHKSCARLLQHVGCKAVAKIPNMPVGDVYVFQTIGKAKD